MRQMMSEGEIETLNEGHCIDCGYRGFVPGPEAGINRNIECGNVKCRARLNVAFYAGRIQAGHRIERRDEGGVEWMNEPKNRH